MAAAYRQQSDTARETLRLGEGMAGGVLVSAAWRVQRAAATEQGGGDPEPGAWAGRRCGVDWDEFAERKQEGIGAIVPGTTRAFLCGLRSG